MWRQHGIEQRPQKDACTRQWNIFLRQSMTLTRVTIMGAQFRAPLELFGVIFMRCLGGLKGLSAGPNDA